MNDRQENKFTMYKAVTDLLDANTAKTASMTAFATALNGFKDIIENISGKNILKGSAASGKTTLKNQLQNNLIESTVPIAAALFALGSATNDPRIQALGNVKKSDLQNLRDTELTDKVTLIKNTADAYAAGLVAYGITAADIAALETKSTAYNTALGGKESGFSTQYAAGGVMSDLFKQADAILEEQLDKMMEKFNPSDQQFYLEYKSAREIKDLGHRFEKPEGPVTPTP
jgi:GTPase SAR1 family protein